MSRPSNEVVLPLIEEAYDRWETEFPWLIETTAAYDVNWKVPDVWRFDLGLLFANGRRRFCCRAVTGRRTRHTAITDLQDLLAGFGVVRITIYHIREPPTQDEIQFIERMNGRLQRHRDSGYQGTLVLV